MGKTELVAFKPLSLRHGYQRPIKVAFDKTTESDLVGGSLIGHEGIMHGIWGRSKSEKNYKFDCQDPGRSAILSPALDCLGRLISHFETRNT